MIHRDQETAIHDAWATLNLVLYATQRVLMGVNAITEHTDTPESVYRIDNESINALWGSVEAMTLTRDMLWDVLQTF